MKTSRVRSRSLRWVAPLALVHCLRAAPASAETTAVDGAAAESAAVETAAAESAAVETTAPEGAAVESAAAAPAATSDAHAGSRAALLNEQGLALYAAQDYRHALERFIGALALEEDPNVLFNIARCYEQLGELDAALEKYEQFLAAPEGDAAGVTRARASIAAITAARQAPRRTSPRTSFQLVHAVSDAPAADPGPPQTSGVPWLLLGGTVAFAAAGATVYVLGARDHAEVTRLPEYNKGDVRAAMTWRRANDLVDSGNTKKLTGGILLGAGGALALTTVVLLLTQDSPRQPEPAIAVAPALLDGGSGLLLAGRFR